MSESREPQHWRTDPKVQAAMTEVSHVIANAPLNSDYISQVGAKIEIGRAHV